MWRNEILGIDSWALEKFFLNTVSVRFPSIQFILLLQSCYFWNKPSSLQFNLFEFLNKQTLIRFDLSFVWNKQSLLGFDLLMFLNKLNSIRFDLSITVGAKIMTHTRIMACGTSGDDLMHLKTSHNKSRVIL